MFSKIDIQKSLGEDIIFFPFKEENIKENSLNLTVSKWAWTLTEVDQSELKKIRNGGEKKYGEKKSCLINKDGKDCIILFPFSTTMVITNEFLAIGKSIGGTIHTRVGTAALGVGHISTMLGPSYMGRLCVPLHNPTCKPIYLPVGDSFLSIIFYRLNSSIKESNHTSKACLEDLKDMESCVAEMKKSQDFISYKQEHSRKYRFQRSITNFYEQNKIIIGVISVLLIIVLLILGVLFPKLPYIKEMRDILMGLI